MNKFGLVLTSAVLSTCMVLGGLWLFRAQVVHALFTSGEREWTSAFENTMPAGTDSISQGDDHIRQLKDEIRSRASVEHAWDNAITAKQTGDAAGHDSGRHREGSARAFFDNTAPTVLNDAEDPAGVDGATTIPDYNPGGAGNSALDDGRLWVDSNAGNTLKVRNQTAGAWENLAALPTNAIILWAETNGDSDCDGVLDDPGACPCGFTRDSTFDGLFARGAHAAVNDVPEEPGVVCDNQFAGGVDALCDAGAAAEYDDTLDTAELPAHTHNVNVHDGTGATPPNIPLAWDGASGAVTAPAVGAALATGGGTTHYHPFKTVLFCKKDA